MTMAECGICLDALRNPVSIPCGHVHCERCLLGHINSGTDALKSTCPTCRKTFHIATPDFAFVPQKYHDFILPPVRRIYVDIPSLTAMAGEVDGLTRRVDGFVKENQHLRQRCSDYKHALSTMATEKKAIREQEEEAREEAADLRRKYDSMKKKYQELLSRFDPGNTTLSSQSRSRRGSQNFDASHELLPKVEELPASLHDLNPALARPKRALPRSRLSSGMARKEDPASQLCKRQRTHRHSDVGSSSQNLSGLFKGEDEDDEY